MRVLLVFLVLLSSSHTLKAQKDSLREAPYKKFPSVPPFKLQLADSSYFTKENLAKKKPVMIMLFSPDCEHCKHQIEEIISHINDFKKVQIIMATMLPFDKMKEFYAHYDLGRFNNIIVGKDANYLLPGFYSAHSLPYLAFYNRKKELIGVSEGSMSLAGILAELAK